MIATVILGVGLLIVAGMFPVAWMKAREQVEETSLANAASAAETLLKAKVRPGRLDATTGSLLLRSSFLGDLGIYPLPPTDGSAWWPGSDDRVHPVNVHNMLSDPAGYPANPVFPEPKAIENLFVPEDLHRIDYGPPLSPLQLATVPLPLAHARFEERLVPPMPLWPAAIDSKFDPAAAANKEIVDQWLAMLRTRRYCWAVLARMNNGYWTTDYINPHPDLIRNKLTYSNAPSWDDSRVFTLYYVTLRRTQDTQRFAQQAFGDPGTDWPPVLPLAGATPATPRALPPDRDTVFPAPWRVQVFVIEPSPAATGIPSEIEVNTTNASTGPIVAGMLPRGAFLIDELNGNVYKVMRRRLYNNDQSAALTLDKEITQKELGQVRPGPTGPVPSYDPDRDRLRTVWVFPPSVELAGRDPNQPSDSVVFDGAQPVVGIEVRPMVLTP